MAGMLLPDTDQNDTVQPAAQPAAHPANALFQPDPNVLARMREAGMPVPVSQTPGPVMAQPPAPPGNSAAAAAMDPIDYMRYAHATPNNPQHAAGNAMSYLIGRMEGILHGVTAAGTAQAAGTPPASLAPPAPTDQPIVAPGARQAAGNFLAQNGGTLSVAPSPGSQSMFGLNYTPQDNTTLHEDHPAHPNNTGQMTREQFIQAARGTPVWVLQAADAMRHQPSMEDQAKKMALAVAGQTGGPAAQQELLNWMLLGQNAPSGGMTLGHQKYLGDK